MGFEWKDVGNAIASAAPTVGGIVGSIFGATPGAQVGSLAGNAVSSLLKALGLADNANPDQVMEAIKADPQAVLKLKMAEMDYNLAMRQKELDETKMNLENVQNARAREVEITKATGKRDINLYVLAWVVMGGFMGLIGFLIFMQFSYGKTLQSDPLVTLLLGSLATDAGLVIGYFFGSSRGSAEKTGLLAKTQSGGKG